MFGLRELTERAVLSDFLLIRSDQSSAVANFIRMEWLIAGFISAARVFRAQVASCHCRAWQLAREMEPALIRQHQQWLETRYGNLHSFKTSDDWAPSFHQSKIDPDFLR
jgi:hypothetical protein